MIVFLNGHLVAEAEASVSIFDRGFLYGDGVFETLLVRNGLPFRWNAHFDRLQRGATVLKILLPLTGPQLRTVCMAVIERNKMREAILRITLSRGPGRRGYSPKGAERPTLLVSTHPAPPVTPPPQWCLHTASVRLGVDSLAALKTGCKLAQVLARAEAEAKGAHEALMLNHAGDAIESSSGNLFWIEGETVFTPPVSAGALPGITRSVVLEACQAAGIPTAERTTTPATLQKAGGVFLTMTGLGVVEALTLDGESLAQSPLTAKLRDAYWATVQRET